MIPVRGRLGHEMRRIMSYRVFFHQLDSVGQELIRLAFVVRQNAQAPYSGYLVGAAVASDETGRIYGGCNVERCSYTQTSHAEQNAADSLVAEEGNDVRISAVAIVAAPADAEIPTPGTVKTANGLPKEWQKTAPCGHCLQCISENARLDRQTWLLSYLADGTVCVTTIADALPYAFVLEKK